MTRSNRGRRGLSSRARIRRLNGYGPGFEWDGQRGPVSLSISVFEQVDEARAWVVNLMLFPSKAERDEMLDAGMEDGLQRSYEALDREPPGGPPVRRSASGPSGRTR